MDTETKIHPSSDGNIPKGCKLGAKRWIILIGLFFANLLEEGSIRTLSLIFDDLTFQYDVSRSYLGAIYGISSGIYTTLSFVSTLLLCRFSVRQLTMVGGIVSALSLSLASYSQTTPQLTATLITFGVGFIFIETPTLSYVNDCFRDRFEMAIGVMSSGGSIGVMIMPWLFEITLNSYGWRSVLLLLGGCNANYIMIGTLLKPKKGTKAKAMSPENDIEHTGHVNPSFEPDSTDVGQITAATEQVQDQLGTRQQSCFGRIVKLFGLRIFKERPLIVLLCVQVYLFTVPFATWLLFTIPNAQAKGLSDDRSAQISIAGGVANFFGRFASGFLFSKDLLPVEIWFMLSNICAAVAFFVNYFADSFWFLAVLSVVFGFTMGFGIPAVIVLLKQTSGNEYYNAGLWITGLCFGTAFPLAGFIAGNIYDRTQSYNTAFFIVGGMSLSAGVAVVLPLLCSRICASRSKKQISESLRKTE